MSEKNDFITALTPLPCYYVGESCWFCTALTLGKEERVNNEPELQLQVQLGFSLNRERMQSSVHLINVDDDGSASRSKISYNHGSQM